MSNNVEVSTYASVDDALDDSKGGFFIFNSSEIKGGDTGKGNLYFTLGTGRDAANVFVPPTWLPFDLLTYGTREDIKASAQLRNLHRNGLIKLLNVDSARNLLKSPGYERERLRVAEEIKNRASSGVNLAKAETFAVFTGEGSIAPDRSGVISQPANPIATISANVSELLSAQKRAFSSGTNSEISNKITQLFPHMTSGEFDQIIANLGGGSSLLFLATSDALQMVNEGQTVKVSELPAMMELDLR